MNERKLKYTGKLTQEQFDKILSSKSIAAKKFANQLLKQNKGKTDLSRGMMMDNIARHYHFNIEDELSKSEEK